MIGKINQGSSNAELEKDVKKIQDKLGKLVVKDIHGLETALQYKSGTDHNHDHRYPLRADFNTLKKEVEKNTQKRITNATITGDVNKTLTLTFNDGSVLQTSFVDMQGGGSPSADVMLNSLNFDPQTGILKGVRSDGVHLDVILDGRYTLNEQGKGLSSNDFTDDLKRKLEELIHNSPQPQEEEVYLLETYNISNTTDIFSSYIKPYGISQNGKTIAYMSDTPTSILINSNSGFVASYLNAANGSISFETDGSKNLIILNATQPILDKKGSTATVSVVGNDVFLRIFNP